MMESSSLLKATLHSLPRSRDAGVRFSRRSALAQRVPNQGQRDTLERGLECPKQRRNAPEGEPQPSAADSARVASWIESERLRAERSTNTGWVMLRRFNRREYNNTMRDLIGINFQAGDDFPEDPPVGGFDNNGSGLTLSPLQIELYAKAAREILDRAIVTETQKPASIKWRFHPIEAHHPGIEVFSDCKSVWRERGINEVEHNMVRIPGGDWNRAVWWGTEHLPRDGDYIIRVRAAGHIPTEQEAQTGARKALADNYQKQIAEQVK